MRKLVLCAAAAIVALASCSKTEVINSEVPQEIGFKAVTGAMTKAETTNDNLSDNPMGVFAYVNGSTNQTYFSNKKFVSENGAWAGAEEQYWPVDHKLDFVVYHPHNVIEPIFDWSKKSLTVGALDSSVDYLYGAQYYNNKQVDGTTAGYGKDTEFVIVDFKHAKAKVTVNMDTKSVSIKNLKLDSQIMEGLYTVVYTSEPASVFWTGMGTKKAVEIIPNNSDNTGLSSTTGYVLIVPLESSVISFDYKMDGSDVFLHYEIPGNIKWQPGYHYIFNIKVTPQEIKFKPTVIGWNDDTNSVPL